MTNRISEGICTVNCLLIRSVKRSALVAVVFAALLALLVGCGSAAQSGANGSAKSSSVMPPDVKVAILHTNDMHGYVNADDGVLGLAAVAQLKADYEAQGYDVVLLDAGDAIQGNLLANSDKGASVIEFMNLVGYDAMGLGDHEFDYGADVLEQRMSEAAFPMLAANIRVDATGELFAQANVVIETNGGLKVGIFALDAPSTKTQSNPKNTLGLTLLGGAELYECAQAQIDDLRNQGCSLVVCLGHLGEEDFAGDSTARCVIEHTTGIDVFIDAHDHAVENELVSDSDGAEVLVVETGCYSSNVGILTFDGETWTEKLVAAGEYDGADQAIAATIAAYADKLEEQLSEVVAHTDVKLEGSKAPGNRDRETNFGDLICDSVLWQAVHAASKTPDAAIVNGGGIRAGIDAGDIARSDIHNVLPFNNQLVVVTVTGEQLLEALEASTQTLPDPEGGFPQVAGITYAVDTTVAYEAGETYPATTVASPAKPGSRVTIIDVGGRGFDLQDTYTIATSDFIAMGGDAYYAFAEAAQNGMEYLGYVDYQAFENYLVDELQGSVPERYAEPQGRISIAIP